MATFDSTIRETNPKLKIKAMYAIIKNIENNTKKSNLTFNEKISVYKDERGFPLAYEISMCSFKGKTFLVLENNDAYLIDSYFEAEWSVESQRRNLFDRSIQTQISNSIDESNDYRETYNQELISL
jgi:hypothetical protein